MDVDHAAGVSSPVARCLIRSACPATTVGPSTNRAPGLRLFVLIAVT